MQSNIYNSITPIFREVFEDEALELHPGLDASQVKNWDSLNHIALIVGLEGLTGITFTADELVSLANVGDFVRLMESKGYVG